MLRHARSLEDFELCAQDGKIGHVSDFLFDDRRWTVRYLVVDTGTWLDHREVLIAPSALQAPRWAERVLPVNLTRQQVRQSPGIDPDEPVSREQELALVQYYSWPMYWGAPGFSDGMMYAAPPFLPAFEARPRRLPPTHSTLDEQHHVRSVDDVRGHRIEANDGDIGHVEDFLLEDTSWEVRYLLVDTRNWWPGKRVLIAPEWVYEVGWDEAKVGVDLTRTAIQLSPAYDPAQPVASEYLDRLHEHYGLPRRSAEP